MTHGANVKLYHSDELGFTVKKPGGLLKVLPKYDVDPMLRGKKSALIQAFCEKGGYISLNEMNNGDFSLRSHARGLGGGPGGATVGCYLGKFLVSFVGHGAIQIVAFASGPAYLATLAGLEATFGPQIEAASQIGAITGGIIGGVATGPG